MHRALLHPAGLERRHHGPDLVVEQHEVAHRERLARAGRQERDPASERERRFERDVADADGQIGPRKIEAHDVGRLRNTLSPERGLGARPSTRLLGGRCLRESDAAGETGERDASAHSGAHANLEAVR